MSERQEPEKPAGADSPSAPPGGQSGGEPPLTLREKIVIAVLYLYVASLVWLVLSHHWYGVLPKWLDPH